jgi:hypothetical protein
VRHACKYYVKQAVTCRCPSPLPSPDRNPHQPNHRCGSLLRGVTGGETDNDKSHLSFACSDRCQREVRSISRTSDSKPNLLCRAPDDHYLLQQIYRTPLQAMAMCTICRCMQSICMGTICRCVQSICTKRTAADPAQHGNQTHRYDWLNARWPPCQQRRHQCQTLRSFRRSLTNAPTRPPSV